MYCSPLLNYHPVSAIVFSTNKHLACALMSHSHSTASSNNFRLILDNALEAYKRRTKHDLLAHPLASRLQACDSPAGLLAILQQLVQDLNQSRSRDDRLTRLLAPTLNVLYTFSRTIGRGVGLVSLRIRTCLRHALILFIYDRCSRPRYLQALAFSQCASFLISPLGQHNAYISQAATNVRGGQDTLVDALERIESFFHRLEVYTEVPPTAEIMNTITPIIVEVLSILWIATKEIKQGRLSQ